MRTIIITVTILAFVNMISGCAYSNQQSRIDEQHPVPARKILAVILNTTIDGYVQTTGDTVVFRDHSGVYDEHSRIITGTLVDGSQASASLDDLDWIRLKQQTLDTPKSLLVDRMIFLSHAEQTPWHDMEGYSRQAGQVVSFKKFGAHYDYASKLITGVTDDGQRAEIDADKVFSVEIKKFSAGRLLLSSAVIGLVIYIASALLVTIEFLNSFEAD